MAKAGNKKFFYMKNSLEIGEYAKCAANPFYFIDNYIKIPHPMLGSIPFKMYGFQRSLLMVYLKQRFSIALKPRQMGISMLVAAYALWLALFHPHKYILIVSIKQSTARSLLRRIKFMYKSLPPFLKMEITNGGSRDKAGTTDEMRFSNNSEIVVSGSTDNAGRSDALSCLIIDEAAFQQHAGTTWGAARPTLSTGGQAIVLSTAFGVGNFFHETYTEAIQGTNGFYPVRLTWQMHPDRDINWYNDEVATMGLKRVSQEIDCDFLKSGYNVFDLAKIRAIEDRILEFPPIQERNFHNKPEKGGALKIFKKPSRRGKYFIGADIASGRARDFSTFSIINAYGVEMACYKGKIGIKQFSELLVKVAIEYNGALLAPESNAIGEGVIQNIQNAHYPNLYHTLSKTMKLGEFERSESLIGGWLTTGKSRHEIITGMDDDLTDDSVVLNNPYFVQEAYTFIYDERNKPIALGKKMSAGKGAMYEETGSVAYSDDSILAACITNEIRKNPHRYRGALPITAGA